MPPGRAFDIVQPRYHPSAKPETAPKTLKKEDVVAVLAQGHRSQTTLPDGTAAPRPTSAKPPLTRRRLLTGAGLIIVIITALWLIVHASSSLVDRWVDLTPIKTDQAVAANATTTSNTPVTDNAAANTTTPDTTPATSVNPFAQAAPAATPAPTPVAAPAAIDPGSLQVRILNGTGVGGAAAQAAAVLKKAGIPTASTGNARHYGYASTLVYYPAGKQDQAALVVQALKGYQASAEENDVAAGLDALVVVGDK